MCKRRKPRAIPKAAEGVLPIAPLIPSRTSLCQLIKQGHQLSFEASRLVKRASACPGGSSSVSDFYRDMREPRKLLIQDHAQVLDSIRGVTFFPPNQIIVRVTLRFRIKIKSILLVLLGFIDTLPPSTSPPWFSRNSRLHPNYKGKSCPQQEWICIPVELSNVSV